MARSILLPSLMWMLLMGGQQAARAQISWPAGRHDHYCGQALELPEYRLRVDDEIDFVYRLVREPQGAPYRLEAGDAVRVESLVDPTLNRELTVQPDGTIAPLLIGPVQAARRTLEEVRGELNERYRQYYRMPDISVSAVRTQTRVRELLEAVKCSCAAGGGGLRVRVAPDGTVSLPAIGSVPVWGLSLDEVKLEVEARYRRVVEGVEISPILARRAPWQVYVVGQVRHPGRYDLTGPTSVRQAIAVAGGVADGKVQPVVVARRAPDGRLIVTQLPVREPLESRCPTILDATFVQDGDLVVVGKAPQWRWPCHWAR